MATCRLFLLGIQGASPLSQGIKEEMLYIGGPPFKDSPLCSVQSSRKGVMLKWNLLPASEQNVPQSILHAIFSLLGVSDFANFFFFWFWIWALSIFRCQNISMSRKTTPYSAAPTTWACFKWSVAFVIRVITSYSLISAAGLTQLPGTLFHALNAFMLLSWNK